MKPQLPQRLPDQAFAAASSRPGCSESVVVGKRGVISEYRFDCSHVSVAASHGGGASGQEDGVPCALSLALPCPLSPLKKCPSFLLYSASLLKAHQLLAFASPCVAVSALWSQSWVRLDVLGIECGERSFLWSGLKDPFLLWLTSHQHNSCVMLS